MLDNEARAIFRVRYNQLKRFLLRFRGNNKSDLNIPLTSASEDLKRIGIFFDFLKFNDSITLTNRGREMLLAYENSQEDKERRILRTMFEKDGQLKLHWALICDKREAFTTADLMPIFRDMGYIDLSEGSLLQYIRAFVGWAESAGLCTKAGVKGHTYTILERMTIGLSTKESKEEQPTIIASKKEESEPDTHLSLFKLNSYICDYLADQKHKGDLDLIKIELEKLRGDDLIDDLIINMLEREINMALETKSVIGFATVAQNLKSLRDRYVEGE